MFVHGPQEGAESGQGFEWNIGVENSGPFWVPVTYLTGYPKPVAGRNLYRESNGRSEDRRSMSAEFTHAPGIFAPKRRKP